MRHSSQFPHPVTVIISLIFIGLAQFFPEWSNKLAPWIVFISFLMVGIPQGAATHILAGEFDGLRHTIKSHLLFYGSYLIIILFVGALWLFYPVAGIFLFLIITVCYFGQADMEGFIDKSAGKWLFYITRGLLVIGLITFSNPTTSFAITGDAMRTGLGGLRELLPTPEIMMAIMISIYTLIMTTGILTRRLHYPKPLLMDSVLLIALLITTDPMSGLSLYFVLWFSAGHIHKMRMYFESKNQRFTVFTFYRKTAPFMIISIMGLMLLLWFNQRFGIQNEFFSLLFILVSVLTLPNMVISGKMYGSVKY